MGRRVRWSAAAAACMMLAAATVGAQTPRTKTPSAKKPAAAAGSTAPKPVEAPAPRVERAVPFKPGESLTYDVSYSGTVSAGEATITVRDKRPSFDSTAYYVVAEGKPSGLLARMYTLYYKADTLVDVFTLLPQRGSIFSQEGKRARQKTTRFNQPAGSASYEIKTATLVQQPIRIAPSTHDALSALMALRTAPLAAGGSLTLPVSDSGRQYTLKLTVEGREQLTTSALTASAWRLSLRITDDKGQAQGRGLYIWMSDDARRLPMKLKAELPVGSFVLELTRVTG